MTEALAFLERFIADEEIYLKLTYSTLDEQEYNAAFAVYASYFGKELKPLPRGWDIDSNWIKKYEGNYNDVHKRKLFMIKQFLLDGRTIYQCYLSRPEADFQKNFFWSLFAEQQDDGFIFISRYLWDSPDFIPEEDSEEMSCWALSAGEDMSDRGKLIATVKYHEPVREAQKAIYHMAH